MLFVSQTPGGIKLILDNVTAVLCLNILLPIALMEAASKNDQNCMDPLLNVYFASNNWTIYDACTQYIAREAILLLLM